MLKILQARIQQYVNQELPDVQAGFRKGRGTRGQVANICWVIEKNKSIPEKHLLLLYWICQSLWLCGSQQTGENSSRDGNTRPPYLHPKICMQVRKQQLEPDTEQQTGSNLGKEYVGAVYCHPAYLTYTKCTSRKMLNWMKHKLESRLPGEITNNLRHADDTILMAEGKELKSLLMKVKEES